MCGRPVSQLNREIGSIGSNADQGARRQLHTMPVTLGARRQVRRLAWTMREPRRLCGGAQRTTSVLLRRCWSAMGLEAAARSPAIMRCCLWTPTSDSHFGLPLHRSLGAATGAEGGRRSRMRYPSPGRRVIRRGRPVLSRPWFGALSGARVERGRWRGHVGIGRIHDLGRIGRRRRRGGALLAILVVAVDPDPGGARRRRARLLGRTRRPALARPAFLGRPLEPLSPERV